MPVYVPAPNVSQEDGGSNESDGEEILLHIDLELLGEGCHHGSMGKDAVPEQEGMHDNEHNEDRSKDRDRFFHTPEVEDDEHDDRGRSEEELELLEFQGKERKYRVRTCGDRDGDRQHVVDEERTP
jgi:hypothetical protein